MCGRRKHSQNKSPQTFDTLAGKNSMLLLLLDINTIHDICFKILNILTTDILGLSR